MKELDFALIGQQLREIRVSKQLTQEYLANKTDVNVSHISNIETNKVKVSLTLLVGLCNAMDVSVDYVLRNEYPSADSAVEKEWDTSKKEAILRLAKAL